MKIGIIGYGKMGKAVETQAVVKGHAVFILPYSDPAEHVDFAQIDCAIDFSHADVALNAITKCLMAGKLVVSGTTGWNQNLEEAKKLCERQNGAFFWAPNFSIGMNVMFYLNEVLADVMHQFDEYAPSILEIHHSEKKDVPSGTAIALAEQVIERIEHKEKWELKSKQPVFPDVLSIESHREADVKGIHQITYQSEEDSISLRHNALSRDGFALGAVIAAEWLEGKTGYFTFEDMLDFTTRC